MSRDYHEICKKIQQSNDQIHQKENLFNEIDSIKKEIKILSKKMDRVYDILVRMINNAEF